MTSTTHAEENNGKEYNYDLITIGVGSGGTRASRISSRLGAKVLAVELPYDPISSDAKGGVGGTCVLRGCVPKKILVYGSSFKADFEDARGFGWTIPSEPKFEWSHLISNKAREIERLNAVYKRILESAGVELIEGRGSIVGPHTVQVTLASGDVQEFTTKHILVATGGRAFIPDIQGKEYGITSDEALSLDEFPKDIAIIGGGYIAVEFAGIFSGMGSKVHLVYRQPQPLRGFDEEMRGIVAENLVKRGMQIHPETNPSKVEKTEDGRLKLYFGKSESIVVDQVMFATGRKPNSQNLGLEKVGVELDGSGAIKVNEYSQTSVGSIWAVGDVTDRINLTPVALMEGQCFAQTVFGGESMRPDHEIVPSAVFCQPPLAVVGLSEEEAAKNSENEVLVFASAFTPMKNTISGRKEKAYMKLLVDSVTNRVLGASMCGADAPEIMQSIAIAMKAGATKKHFDSTVGIHPSAAEEFVTLREPKRRVGGKK